MAVQIFTGRNLKWWLMWLVLSLGLGAYNAYALLAKDDKSLYLPGQTSHGHYQIELACDSCHGEAFAGDEAIQNACMECHGAELKAVDDSHPKSKFTDPRNADRVAILDARVCVTCHVEHRPERTGPMGVTLAADFCAYCHQKIAKDRPSHEGMGFDSCASAGCHNYHDNQALYEDFLVKHADEPVVLDDPRLPGRDYGQWLQAVQEEQPQPLSLAQADAPLGKQLPGAEALAWADSGHAAGGVNCSGCHRPESQTAWIDRPGLQVCKACHAPESETFVAGRHGMRLAQGLSPMTPAQARLPMKEKHHDTALGCSTCHGGHEFNLRQAAVEACLQCHDDEHSRAYKASSHYTLWQQEQTGELQAGRGLSCAGCHLPREQMRQQGHTRIRVQHNQNANLRPNEKMLRDVCMHCHGYEFAVNALADPALIRNNFAGRPAVNIDSVEMAVQRERDKRAADG